MITQLPFLLAGYYHRAPFDAVTKFIFWGCLTLW